MHCDYPGEHLSRSLGERLIIALKLSHQSLLHRLLWIVLWPDCLADGGLILAGSGVYDSLIRSKILAHKFVYPTDAELELDFPASVPSWECRDESRFRLLGCSVLEGDTEG